MGYEQMIGAFGNIGAGFSAGVQGVQDAKTEAAKLQMLIEQAHQQAQRQKRQFAEQDFGLIQKRAAATKDPAQLAALANEGTQVLRKGGFNVPNQKIVGGMALLPQPRSTPDMQGPMPLTRQHTFDTPQTKAQSWGMLLLPQPQTDYKIVDHGAAGAGYWETPPEGAPTYKETRKPIIKTPSIRYEDDEVQEDGTIIRKRPAKGRSGGSGKVRTKTETINGRRVLINADTGDPIKDLGAAGSPKVKTVTDAELREQARFEAGTPPTADDELINPGAKAAHNARVQQNYRRLKSQANQQAAPQQANNGIDPALAAHVMKALAGRKGNKQ